MNNVEIARLVVGCILSFWFGALVMMLNILQVMHKTKKKART